MQRKLWNKDFILLLQGHAVSTLGDLMYSVAIGYWVYEETGSNSLMGVMSAVSMFVTMFLSPFTGSIIDRSDRKWIIVGTDLMQGILMLAVGVLAFVGKLNVPIVLLAALLAAFGSVIYTPAVSTLMIDIIPHGDMVRGQSVYSGSKSLIRLVGSAFSGVMVAFLGVPVIVVINGLSNLYSAVTELFVHVPKTARQGTQVRFKSILADTKTALRMVFADRFLSLFVPCVLLMNLLAAGPISLLLPFCLEKGFAVDAYGYLTAIYMIASLLGMMLLGILKLTPKQRYAGLVVGFIGTVPFMVLVYLSRRFVPMSIMACFAAFLNCVGNTIFDATMMLALPEESRGAILGFIESASVGGSAISTVIYGFLGDLFPLYLVFAVGTVITLFPMLYLCLSPRTREFMLKT